MKKVFVLFLVLTVWPVNELTATPLPKKIVHKVVAVVKAPFLLVKTIVKYERNRR